MADITYLYLDKEYNSTQDVLYSALGADKNNLTPPATFVSKPYVTIDNSRGKTANGEDTPADKVYISNETITGFTITIIYSLTSAAHNYHNIRIIGE